MTGFWEDRGGEGGGCSGGGRGRRCRSILRNLYRVLEESSGDEVCGEIRKHLDGCPDCAGQYEALQRLAQICRTQPKASLPEETKQRIKKSLLEALALRSRGRRAGSGAGTG